MKYKGKCVEVIPHISYEIKRRINEIRDKSDPDFLIIEVGGTIGDYQNILFLDALRLMKVEGEDVMFCHVAYLPIPSKIGEMKTKPLQHSVRALNARGIQPNMIFCRSKVAIDKVRRRKINMFTNVDNDKIISAMDVENVYEIPMIFHKNKVTEKILEFFNMDKKKVKQSNFKPIIKKLNDLDKKIKIAIIGKYFDIGKFTLSDSYISVIEAIKHASYHNDVIPEIEWLDSKKLEETEEVEKLKEYSGIIVPGGFGTDGVEGKMNAIRFARENNIPYLGLCYGMQLALVEFSRNICNLKNASSDEINSDSECKIVDVMESQKEVLHNNNYGGTMRLGSYAAIIKPDSKVYSLYKDSERFEKNKEKIEFLKKDEDQKFRLGKINKEDIVILERHRHRYEIATEYISKIEDNGMIFSGYHHRDDGTKLMEFIELPNHKFFVATQAHPEFKSSLNHPAPLFVGFTRACKEKS